MEAVIHALHARLEDGRLGDLRSLQDDPSLQNAPLLLGSARLHRANRPVHDRWPRWNRHMYRLLAQRYSLGLMDAPPLRLRHRVNQNVRIGSLPMA